MATVDTRSRFDLVAVGGSAGALEALCAFLPALQPEWNVPIVVVLHLPRGGASGLAAVLGAQTPLRVSDAVDKAPLEPGTIHVGIPGYHLLVDAGPRLALSVDEPVHHSMPALDVLFESAAATCGPRVAGIVLSGANEDGAAGLAAIWSRGGIAAVQAPEDAKVPTMPAAALRACPEANVVPARDLASFLRAMVGTGSFTRPR
jgi:two-component system, chemotaxis family, protein-glutamate methylesterase/glutaminase